MVRSAAMSPAVLEEVAVSPLSALGPYGREDYDRLPDEPRCELLYGRLVVSPSPSLLHQFVLLEIVRFLADVGDRCGGAALVSPVDVYLAPHSVVQPDALYVSTARRSILGAKIEGAPDLVVEVLSPGTARRDRGDKLRLYAESGVGEYWVVDGAERQIEFLVADGHGSFRVALPIDGIYRSARLPELELDLERLWQGVERKLPR